MTTEEMTALARTIADNITWYHKEVLTLDEAARYTGFTKSYLYKLTSLRQVRHYKPTGKNCFFRRADLDEWLTENPVATTTDINSAAQAYCMTHKRP